MTETHHISEKELKQELRPIWEKIDNNYDKCSSRVERAENENTNLWQALNGVKSTVYGNGADGHNTRLKVLENDVEDLREDEKTRKSQNFKIYSSIAFLFIAQVVAFIFNLK